MNADKLTLFLIIIAALLLVDLVIDVRAMLAEPAPVVVTATPTVPPTMMYWTPSPVPTVPPSPTATATRWPTPTQELQPTATVEPCRVTVMPGVHLNMRELPDITSRIVLVLDPETVLDVFELRVTGAGKDTLRWYRVGGFGAERGWIAVQFVSRSGDCRWLS